MTTEFLGTPFANLLAKIQEQYPQYVNFLSQPGVLQVFLDANADPASWSPERIQSAIQQTDWYKTQDAAQRKFQLLTAADPATAHQLVQDTDLIVRRVQAQLGVTLDPTDALLLTLNATQNGWNEDRVKMEVVAMAHTGQPQAGTVGDTMSKLNGLADQYGVPIGHDDLYWWGANVAAGNQTSAGFEQFVRNQAINLYPALKPFLEQGHTVAEYAQPYFALAQQELGINLRNPKWMSLVLSNDDKGNQGVNSLQEALSTLRTDPSFGYDAGLPGKTQSAQFAQAIGKEFGAIG